MAQTEDDLKSAEILPEPTETALLRTERDRLQARFALFARLARRLTGTLDPTDILQEVVQAACELTDARYGALGLFGADGNITDFITHGVTEEQRTRIGDLPRGRGLLGLLQTLQEPIRVADISQHEASVGFPPNHPPMKSFMGTPVRYEGEALGNLYLTEKIGEEQFSEEDEQMLVLLADQAAMAIHNARLHQEAQDQQARLTALLEVSPIGVFVVSALGHHVDLVNREAARLLGMAVGEHGSPIDMERTVKYLRPDGTEPPREELPLRRALLRGERVIAEELQLVFQDGRIVPALVNAAPVYDLDGNISSAITVIQDISPIAEMEKLRNEFLGMVSHELKTPLTAIKGSAAMALGTRRPLSPDETRELFSIIDEQSDRLKELVDNLLDVTRIEAGTLAISPEPMDLAAIVNEAALSLARTRGVREVRTSGLAGVPLVNADPSRILQVLVNLLNNAAKFSPPNMPIDVTVTHDAHQVTVQVKDHGRGISPDQAGQLFTKFAQLPDEQGRMSPGNGLGLAICKGIVEAHGGRIWAESPGLGQGTTLTFILPLGVAQAPATDEPAPPIDVTQRSEHLGHIGRPGQRTQVLVVDDDPQVLRYVQRTLQEAGFHPVPVTDPQEALRLVEAEAPDLVVMDLGLPGMDGFGLLSRLRQFSGVPVIFLTARDDRELAARALRMGADDYVTKPFAPSELIARIEASLRRRVLSDRMEVRPPYSHEGLEIDFNDRRVTINGEVVVLSATEYKLLLELAINAGRVLTHEHILHAVWGPEYSGESELVRSFVRNLRKKLRDDARNPRYILTEPQVGYRMTRPAGI